MVRFKVGDAVCLKAQERYKGTWAGPLMVEHVSPTIGSVHARHPVQMLGSFPEEELELMEGPW